MTILRHAMTIRLDHNALEQKRQYLKADYRPLEIFYGEKRFQIHVMQEYALCALKNLQNGWELYGNPTLTFDGEHIICGQAVVKESDGGYDPEKPLSEY